MSAPGPPALDLDGTLLEPGARQRAVLEAVLEREPTRPPVDPEAWWRIKRDGQTGESALRDLGLDPELARQIITAWTAEVEQPRWLALDRPLAGVEGALAALAAAGTRPAILTARRYSGRVHDQVAALGLDRWCSPIVVVEPAAASEAKASELRELGAVAFVGDTESDARAAQIAGLPFAAVTTGQRSREFLESQKIKTFDSLAAAFAELGLERLSH